MTDTLKGLDTAGWPEVVAKAAQERPECFGARATYEVSGGWYSGFPKPRNPHYYEGEPGYATAEPTLAGKSIGVRMDVGVVDPVCTTRGVMLIVHEQAPIFRWTAAAPMACKRCLRIVTKRQGKS